MCASVESAGARRGQEGFSLVELAIVLIIIGLIVGGVLKGQELIESARVNSVQTQLNEIRVASTTFLNKYGDLPGDIQAADAGRLPGAPNFGGDGNGRVDTAAGTPENERLSTGTDVTESTAFWQHLRLAGLIGGVTENSGNPGVTTGNEALASRVGGIYSILFETRNDSSGHWIQLGTEPATADGNNDDPILTPNQLRGIDVKSDDGVPTSGNIGGFNATTATDCVDATTTPDSYATSGGDTVNCAAIFKL